MPVPDAWLGLNAAPGIGPVRFHQLLRAWPRLDEALGVGAARLASRLPFLDAASAGTLLKAWEAFDVQGELHRAGELGVRLISFRDVDYPKRLLAVPTPPPLHYVRGQLPPDQARCVAVVGTRRPTAYGLDCATRLAGDLARAGVAVVSGLARGIDAAAHLACLEAGGQTLACLGNGLASTYPGEHAGLAGRIVESGGAVLSQFPLGAGPSRMHFPMRNGLIAGLSQGVLVVEVERDSGSLITADLALDLGRDVYAVPGPVNAPMSEGPLALIAEGARLVRSVKDVLEELQGERPAPRSRQSAPEAPVLEPLLFFQPQDERQRRLLEPLRGAAPLALDEWGSRCGLDAQGVSAAALELELLGAVRQVAGGRYELASAQPAPSL